MKGTILKKKKYIGREMRAVIFSTAFFWTTSYYKKNWAPYDQNYALVFM